MTTMMVFSMRKSFAVQWGHQVTLEMSANKCLTILIETKMGKSA